MKIKLHKTLSTDCVSFKNTRRNTHHCSIDSKLKKPQEPQEITHFIIRLWLYISLCPNISLLTPH